MSISTVRISSIEVRLNTDYLENKAELDELADKVVYTGPIDAYFDYKLGTLEYRSVRFENEILDKPSFQGNAAVNYTDRETPWTRIIEHKWFEFGKDENGNDLPKTIISREYSSEWKPGDEPYYPVNDAKNSLLYSEYKKLAEAESKVIFGGRLGEYSPSAEYKRVPDKIINKAKQWSEQYPKKIEFQEAYFGLLFSRLKYAQAQDMRNEQRRVYREMKTVAERANYSEYNESNQLMESVDILHRVFGY